MNKQWHEAPSLNFKVAICKEMLTGDGITKLFQTCPTRTTIPKDLRPRSLFSFDKSYVIAFLNDAFSRIGATLDHDSLTATLSTLADSNRTLKLNVTVNDDDIENDGYCDDFGHDYEIALKIVQYFAVTENPDTARNEKATKLAKSIQDIISKDVYNRAIDDYNRAKLRQGYKS